MLPMLALSYFYNVQNIFILYSIVFRTFWWPKIQRRNARSIFSGVYLQCNWVGSVSICFVRSMFKVLSRWRQIQESEMYVSADCTVHILCYHVYKTRAIWNYQSEHRFSATENERSQTKYTSALYCRTAHLWWNWWI